MSLNNGSMEKAVGTCIKKNIFMNSAISSAIKYCHK